MRFSRSKSGGMDPIQIVGALVVVAFVVYIYFAGPLKIIAQGSNFFGKCWGGQLVEPEEFGSDKKYDPVNWQQILSNVPKTFAKEEDKNKICIIPTNDKANEQLTQEEQPSAVKGPQILVTLDDSITPLKNGQTVNLDAYRTYAMHIQIPSIDAKSTAACTVHIVDPTSAGRDSYFFVADDSNTPPGDIIAGKKSRRLKPVRDPQDTFTSCIQFIKSDFTFLIDEKYAQRPLEFEFIMHSPGLAWPIDPQSNSILKPSDDQLIPLASKRIGDVAQSRLGVTLHVNSALEITGISNQWAQKATITLTCKNILCEDIILGTVYPDLTGKTDEQKADYLSQWSPQKDCEELMQNPVGKTTKLIHNLPLNTNINTPNTNPLEVSLKPEKTNKQLGKTFTVDAKTLQQDFGKKLLQTDPHEHLCFQVGFNLGPQSSDKIIKASDQPLLIDTEPPTFAKELAKIHYNTPNNVLTSQDKFDPKISVSGTNLYIPPEACSDNGGSGCTKYYSYYTSININLPTTGGDPLQKIIGKVMGEAFNILYAKSLTDADCKPALDSSYKPLANYKAGNPTLLPINQPGLGYVCLYPEDQVGNKGKPAFISYLNPYQLTQQALS